MKNNIDTARPVYSLALENGRPLCQKGEKFAIFQSEIFSKLRAGFARKEEFRIGDVFVVARRYGEIYHAVFAWGNCPCEILFAPRPITKDLARDPEVEREAAALIEWLLQEVKG